MAESFFAALKNECVYRTQYPTREHARRDVVRYIEFWYNSKRRHSDFSTGPRYKSTMSIWNSRSQRELTVNPLSGKLGADQTFSTAKDPATNNIAHGWTRLTGLTPITLWLTCLPPSATSAS
jgi:hypothetical protein